MTVHSLSAAKRLCERSGWSLTNLQLQKLLYIAHMLHLGRHHEPLVTGTFEAWDYGPVEPTVYRRARSFGAEPVGNVFQDVRAPDSGTEASALDETLTSLGRVAPSRLVAITHWDRGAWSLFYKPGIRGSIIPNGAIADEYRARVGNA